jgi:hypothetical protein
VHLYVQACFRSHFYNKLSTSFEVVCISSFRCHIVILLQESGIASIPPKNVIFLV